MATLSIECCQKIDLEDNNSPEKTKDNYTSSTIISNIKSTGQGLITSPLTVKDVINGKFPNIESKTWVIGYVVGATKTSLSNAEFSDSTSYSTSILLAMDSMCTDVTYCIPVELNTEKLKKAYAIPNNRKAFRKSLLVLGTLKPYYKVNGLREVSEGHWLFGFDISFIAPEPEEWGERDIN